MVKLNIEMFQLKDPEHGLIDMTDKQIEAVRSYAQDRGYTDLRGFHWSLKRGDMDVWDYYDALRAIYT